MADCWGGTRTSASSTLRAPYLYDDFAFATREGLIPKIARHEDAKKMKEKELNTPFSEIKFDFTLTALAKKDAEEVVNRHRVEAA